MNCQHCGAEIFGQRTEFDAETRWIHVDTFGRRCPGGTTSATPASPTPTEQELPTPPAPSIPDELVPRVLPPSKLLDRLAGPDAEARS